MSGLLPWSDGCTGGLPSSVLSQLVVRPDTCYAQGDVLIDSSTGESIAFVPGPETSEAVQIELVFLSGRVAQGRPRLGRGGPPRFRQRSAQPACRWRKSQLRQGFPGHQRLVAAQRGIPLRIRRTAGCGENHLAALGFGERETRDGSGVGPLLAEGDQAAAGCKRMSHPHVVRFGG
jgi:hypothetical protein